MSAASSRRPLTLGLDDLRARPAQTLAVTLECAGNGRALLSPRSLSQPWLLEAVGTAEWTGTPLAPLLREAGLAPDATEVVFTGLDRGIQGGVEHVYERSLALDDALRDEVLLAYAVNGEPLPPQHGYPLRLIVPGWYGMTHVKWLRTITVAGEAFRGWQQETAYRMRQSEDEAGTPVTRMLPRSLLVPPGHSRVPVAHAIRRRRAVLGGRARVVRAWGRSSASRSVPTAALRGRMRSSTRALSPYAWAGWRFAWDASPGRARAVLSRDGRRRKHAADASRRGTSTATATTRCSASA